MDKKAVSTDIERLIEIKLHCTKVLLQIIPNVYDTDGVAKIIGEDNIKDVALSTAE